VFSPLTSKEEARAYILGPTIATYVAVSRDDPDCDREQVLGFYKLIANQRDLGSHVSNASFMVSPHVRGRGIGKSLVRASIAYVRIYHREISMQGLHCIEEAKRRGFFAMQVLLILSSR
jgi:GNAT superfamily N-acetyltransferase